MNSDSVQHSAAGNPGDSKSFWMFRKLEDEFTFTRREFPVPGISRRHFQILHEKAGWKLLPLSETNPIRVNDRIISEPVVLHSLDQIKTGLLNLVFLPQGLLVQIPEEYQNPVLFEKGVLPERKSPLIKQADGKAMLQSPMLEEAVSLEAPGLVQPTPAPHWFSVLGPSLMILVSSLASAGTMLLRPGADLSSVLGMSTTSLTMAGAFLAYGLVNRKITSRTADQNIKKQEELYLAYLREQEEVLQEKIVRNKAAFERQKASLTALDLQWKGSQKKEDWSLPVYEIRKSAAAFALPSIRYDQREQKTVQALEAMEGASLWSPDYFRFSRGDVLRLNGVRSSELEDLFLLWNWMVWHPGRRFVRVGNFSWSSSWMEKLPSVLLEGQSLCFSSLKEFEQKAAAFPQLEWTVLCEAGRFDERIAVNSSASWICISKEVPRTEGMIVLNKEARTRQKILQILCTEEGRRKNPAAGWPVLLQDDHARADAFRGSQARLEVVLGLDEQGEEVKWDLEKEGPHALIAGTTGSGKSEGLASVLLQLALYNSARQVQFLLIDFKGGAFLSQFQGFPHFAGALTNLESGDFVRLQKALDQELERRQKILQGFSEEHPFAIQDVSTYNCHHPEAVLSHLFIVVDEFAQMKARFPEAMAYMQEAARIGRSLGIHLILATQKPAGIVDEQIWSNSRSRLCFMVHAEADSRQVLGHGKAASLKQPGEFILQVSGKEQEKQGRALFSRASCKKEEVFAQCDENRRPIHVQNQTTMAMRIAALAAQANEQQDLLLVNFEGPRSREHFAFTDEISSLHPLDVRDGENLMVLSDEKGMAEILQRLQDTRKRVLVKTEQVHSLSGVQNHQSLSKEELWQLLDLNAQENVLLVISAEELRAHPLHKELLTCRHITLMIVTSRMETAYAALASKMDLRLALNVQDKESLYLLFERLTTNHSSPSRGLCLKDQQLKSFVLSKPEKETDQRQETEQVNSLRLLPNRLSLQDLSALPSFLMGFSAQDGRPICWSRKRDLVIVIALERLKAPLETLLSCWKSQDPLLGIGPIERNLHVSLLVLPQQQSLLMNPDIMQKIQNSSLLYLGTDYSEHQFLLKRRGRQEGGSLLYFEEEEPLCGRLPQFLEEKGG